MGLANCFSLCPLVSLGRTNGFGLVHPEPAKALVVAWVVACTSRAVLLLPVVSLPYDTGRKAIAGYLARLSRRSWC